MSFLSSSDTSNTPWLSSTPQLVLIGVILFSSTYVFTKARYAMTSNTGQSKGQEPPTLPYSIPFLGNSLLINKDAHAFYVAAQEASGAGGIIGTRIGPMYSYIISGASNIQTVYRNSKAQSMDALVLKVYRNCFGVPKVDLVMFEEDTSGHATIPLTNVPEEKRIWRHVNDPQSKALQSADQMKVLSAVFTREFLAVMDEKLPEDGTVLLWKFFRNKMTTASSISLVGSNVYKQSPQTTEDFWEWFVSFLSFFIGFPRFLIPKPWDARKRLTDSLAKHLRSVEERYDSIQAADPDWDPDLGSRMNRLRDKATRDDGVSIEGRGTLLLGFMMGINGNAIPIAGWILLELIQNPSLLASVREEIATAIVLNDADAEKENFEIDIPALTSLPLLSSVYTETLRLRMSTTSARQLRTDLDVGNYTLKKGNWVFLPAYLAHIKNSEWSHPSHPTTEFWAERFVDNKTQPKPGHFFPFGGGSTMCPGRFFAKQEILIAIAITVMKFDIEFVEVVGMDGKARKKPLSFDPKGAGAGGMLPDGDLRCKIRRRV